MNDYIAYVFTRCDENNQVIRVKARNRVHAIFVSGQVLGNTVVPEDVTDIEIKLMRRG